MKIKCKQYILRVEVVAELASWQSSCLQHQKSAVRTQSLTKNWPNHQDLTLTSQGKIN